MGTNCHTKTCVTPRSRVFLQKLTTPQLLKKFPAFYGIQRSITVFTTARHLCLSWGQSLQSSPSRIIILRYNIILPPTLRWRSSLRHCARSPKFAGSIPDGVSGIFHWLNPSGRTMALGSIQPLTAMSTRNTSWGVKAAGAHHLHVPTVWRSGSLNLLES